MEGFKALATIVVFLVGLNGVSSECTLHETSSANPYLVRIIDCNEINEYWPFTNLSQCLDNNTVAHGSLISADKVLTACSWFSKDQPRGLTFRAYNTKDGCVQERSSYRSITHKDCNQAAIIGDDGFLRNDYAVWIVDEPFDVDIKAVLWKGQWGGIRPPKLNDMEAIIRSMDDKKPTCKAALFSNASAVDGVLETDANVEFISWKDCLATLEHIFPVDDDPVDKPLRKFGSYQFSCGRDKGISGFRFGPPRQIGYDWRSGAAVVCDVDGKQVPIGMFSRIIAPAPWAKTPSFRVTVGFDSSFYEFLYNTAGIQPEPDKNPRIEEECKISGENYYPYLLRIVKKSNGFDPLITMGHGALIQINMVLSSCTPYRELPKDLTKDENWMFWGYNPKKGCAQKRRPTMIYKHKDCTKFGPDEIMVNDFAIWTPNAVFDVDDRIHYPNLWQGPNKPPMQEVVWSIIELSDDSYIDIISRRLRTGIFLERTLVTGERQQNAEVEFVPWEDCKLQLEYFVLNTDTIQMEFVVDKNIYPVFCGYEDFRSTGPKTNVSKADWFSGAILMYSYLYVYEWGEEPSTVTIPLGVFSRVVVGQSKPEGNNIRVVAGFTKSFYDFLDATESEIHQFEPRGSQPPSTSSALGTLILGILMNTTFLA